MTKRFVSPEEFCQLTGWSASTVRRRLKDGSLPAVQPGGRRTLWLIDVEAFQAGQARSAAPPSPPSNSNSTADQEADATSSARLPGPRPGWRRGR